MLVCDVAKRSSKIKGKLPICFEEDSIYRVGVRVIHITPYKIVKKDILTPGS